MYACIMHVNICAWMWKRMHLCIYVDTMYITMCMCVCVCLSYSAHIRNYSSARWPSHYRRRFKIDSGCLDTWRTAKMASTRQGPSKNQARTRSTPSAGQHRTTGKGDCRRREETRFDVASEQHCWRSFGEELPTIIGDVSITYACKCLYLCFQRAHLKNLSEALRTV